MDKQGRDDQEEDVRPRIQNESTQNPTMISQTTIPNMDDKPILKSRR